MHARMNPDAEYLLRPHKRLSSPDLLTHAFGLGSEVNRYYIQSLFTKYRIYPLPPKK